MDASGSVKRVSWFPHHIEDQHEYWSLLDRFQKVLGPEGNGSYLDPETTSYFWVRLRNPEKLRLEYRPMEMAENWQERVRYLVNHALTFPDN